MSSAMPQAHTLNMRLDAAGKGAIARAAGLRRLSISDYIRVVLVQQAQREVAAAGHQVLTLTAAEQQEFWTALHEPIKLTPRQRKLGRLMRGA